MGNELVCCCASQMRQAADIKSSTVKTQRSCTGWKMINLWLCSFEPPDSLWTGGFQNAFQSAAFIEYVGYQGFGFSLKRLWRETRGHRNCAKGSGPAGEMPKCHCRQFHNLFIFPSPRRKASSGALNSNFSACPSLHVNNWFFLTATHSLPAQPVQTKCIYLTSFFSQI